ncbi:Uncharacterized protein FWK35_00033496 [Aphis craccivora]|uniref:Uncharacterized protein n=1 Tax=Aphis craccivora TaxID=307492 RepID=A0A6G0VYY9_APHCR|nr:Uncharacterized protein FWK35_00033496 [Aphis craccivora]
MYLRTTCKLSNAWARVVLGKANSPSSSITDSSPLDSLGISWNFKSFKSTSTKCWNSTVLVSGKSCWYRSHSIGVSSSTGSTSSISKRQKNI